MTWPLCTLFIVLAARGPGTSNPDFELIKRLGGKVVQNAAGQLSINLSSSVVRADHIKAMRFANVVDLDISNSLIGDSGAAHLAEGKTLKTLKANGSFLSAAGVELLLGRNSLEDLDISNVPLVKSTAKAICSQRTLQR